MQIDSLPSIIYPLPHILLPSLKVRGPFVETFCIEKNSYIDAI